MTTTPNERIDAMQQLLDEHSRALLAYVTRNLPLSLRRQLDPADVLHDIFLQAYRRVSDPSWREPDAAWPWLKQIAKHRLSNVVRDAGRQKRGGARLNICDGVTDEQMVGLLESLSIFERTPSRSAIDHETAALLQQAIDDLTDPGRSAVRMRFVAGKSLMETAAALGKSEPATSMICARALKRLGELMAEVGAR